MKHTQQGFTLVELVVVIVILGILAATAVPKFVDLREDAEKATLEAFAGSISSATTLNYAKRSLSPDAGQSISGTVGQSMIEPLLQGGWPAKFTADSWGNCTDGSATAVLKVSGDAAAYKGSVNATVICIN